MAGQLQEAAMVCLRDSSGRQPWRESIRWQPWRDEPLMGGCGASSRVATHMASGGASSRSTAHNGARSAARSSPGEPWARITAPHDQQRGWRGRAATGFRRGRTWP
ncbi:unnamed protein product [Urochloa humidicola]